MELAVSWTAVCVCVCVHTSVSAVWGEGRCFRGSIGGPWYVDMAVERTPAWSYQSGLDSWHSLCDLGLVLSLLSITWDLGLVSQHPASLKADINWEEEREEEREEVEDQNLLETQS